MPDRVTVCKVLAEAVTFVTHYFASDDSTPTFGMFFDVVSLRAFPEACRNFAMHVFYDKLFHKVNSYYVLTRDVT